MTRLFRWALSSYWTWLVYLSLLSPWMLLGILLEHLWVLCTAAYFGLREVALAWKQELRPLWSSFFDLFTRATHARARSLGRASVAWRTA